MPTYTIFAGVNGAGKTSIYKSIYYDEINVYDNTEMFREIIFVKDSKFIWKDKKMPSWAMNILSD